MKILGNMAQHRKPLSAAVLVLFAFLTGYTSFHYHESPHCQGDCSVQQTSHSTGEEIAATQSNCNICFYAASPRNVHTVEHTGTIETGMFLLSAAEQRTPQYSVDYSSPLRGPPALSLS